jgi:hypothetical protein
MQKSVHGTVFLSIVSLLISYNLVFASVLKTEALGQKTYEISSLRVKIIDKIDQAVEMRARLEHELADLQGEIQSEQIRAGIYSYQEALQNLRIRFNLSLIQVLRTYVKQLNERIAYFQKGNEHLRFLALQIKDDIALINTLTDMETGNLNGRINRVLDEFIPETKKPIFNVTGIRLLSIERVWNETSIKFRLN